MLFHKSILKLWHRVQIAYGSRCKCGGMIRSIYEDTGWHRGKCENCGTEQKW